MARTVEDAARWVLVGAAVLPLAAPWYIASLPPLARAISMGEAPAVTIFAGLTIFFSVLLVALVFVSAHLYARSFNIGLAMIALALGLVTTGVTEWVREAVRKPYLIYGHMWSNGIRVADAPRLRAEGVLPSAKCVTSVFSAESPASESSTLAGRRVTYNPIRWRSCKRPCSGRTSGRLESHCGPPTAPNRIAFALLQIAMVSAGRGTAVASIAHPPTSPV